MIVLPFKGDFVVFDTETTGLVLPSAAEIHLQPYMTEFYGIRIDKHFEMVSEFGSMVKPPIPIPEEVTKITGINDSMVANAPSFIQIFDKIVELFFGARVGVGHNVSFDMDILKYEMTRHDLEFMFPWTPQRHCTVELSFPIKNKRLNLSALHELATGRPHFNAHRAKDDVMATVRCYQWLFEKGFIQ